MNITNEQLKKLIKESIDEVLSEIGAIDYDDYEPMDSEMDHAGEWLDDLKDSLAMHLKHVDDDNDPNGDHYKAVWNIYDKVSNFLENPDVPSVDKDSINHDGEWESLLGRVHSLRGSGGEKMYVNETWDEAISSGGLMEKVMNEVAPPGMEGWVKDRKQGFIDQYGKKKGLSVLYAKAWKEFYKHKNK